MSEKIQEKDLNNKESKIKAWVKKHKNKYNYNCNPKNHSIHHKSIKKFKRLIFFY